MSWIGHNGAQEEFLQRTEFEVLFGGAAGPGKELSLDTLIPTPDGWTTMGDVQTGDAVFSDAGEVCTVLQALAPEPHSNPRRASSASAREQQSRSTRRH